MARWVRQLATGKIGPLRNEKKVHEELGTNTINFTEREPFKKSKLKTN